MVAFESLCRRNSCRVQDTIRARARQAESRARRFRGGARGRPTAALDRQPYSYVVGDGRGRVRELRDPAIHEENERTYLLYSVAGEGGIAIAELEPV